MNAERIDLYKAVQGRRGEWQVGDRVYLTRMNEYGTVHTLRSDGDIDVRFYGGWTLDCCHDDPDLLWLPPVWDEDCPERCLIGMIGWCDIFKYEEPDGQPRYTVWHRGCHFQATTLPEALLRAIREGKG